MFWLYLGGIRGRNKNNKQMPSGISYRNQIQASLIVRNTDWKQKNNLENSNEDKKFILFSTNKAY